MFIVRNKRPKRQQLICSMNKNQLMGFTLLEILIALFIFTIVSLILSTSLRNVIDAQARTEKKAERLAQLQMGLLIMSHDIEQVVNRPILSATEKESPALVGNAQSFTFTHTGFANSMGLQARSILGRTGYTWNGNAIWRMTWPVLDQTPDTQPHARLLLPSIVEAQFQYLDQEGRFHRVWPIDNQGTQVLPKAIKINLTLNHWGKISQIYVIPAQNSKQLTPPPKS